LVRRVLNPLSWFGSTSRTEMAVGYYDKKYFQRGHLCGPA
jgi:hypothetical protein